MIYGTILGIGTIFSSTDTVCTLQVGQNCFKCFLMVDVIFVCRFGYCSWLKIYLQVLSQEETPLLYSLVFGEGVVNDATSVVIFNTVQKINADTINGLTALHICLNFLYLFTTSLQARFLVLGLVQFLVVLTDQ